MTLRLPRPDDQRDLVLYLPDEILIVDHMRQQSRDPPLRIRVRRPFHRAGCRARPRRPRIAAEPSLPLPPESDHGPGEYAALVRRAKEAFMRGDLFEVVCGQLLATRCPDPPSLVYRRLRRANPAPYGALINLGEGEFLVSASPEMYVRVEGRRIETCPICGTIARGRDALEDAERIRELLNSTKDESELTMCTDVDRNDKSRVCVPGSVKVIGRRQIEIYSRLIHTVDHVEGELRPEFDALDGFFCHTWAVTVTGAPKLWAIRWIEQEERSPRRWYGGAIGRLTFDGNMNTGLTLRTLRMQDGVAEIRAGATLLYDSDPEAEEAECRLKAAALLSAIRGDARRPRTAQAAVARRGDGERAAGAADRSRGFVRAHAGRLCPHDRGRVRDAAPRFRAGAAEARGCGPIWCCCRRGRGGPTISRCARRSICCCGAISRSSACASGCRALSSISAARSACSGCRCTASRRRCAACRAGCSGLAGAVHGRSLSLALCRARPVARRCWRSRRRPRRTASSWRSSTGLLPIAAVQFHPELVLTAPGEIGMPILEAALAQLCEPAAAAE